MIERLLGDTKESLGFAMFGNQRMQLMAPGELVCLVKVN